VATAPRTVTAATVAALQGPLSSGRVWQGGHLKELTMPEPSSGCGKPVTREVKSASQSSIPSTRARMLR